MLRAVILGCGAVVAELYADPLRRLEKGGALEVAAIVDPSPERRARLAAEFRRPVAYGDAEEAFGAQKFDLAFITSPPGLHAEHALLAFRHGSHVFCEKPMTTSAKEAERMIAGARAADRLLGVAFPRRFYPNFADVAALLAGGELGTDITFSCREGGTYDWPVASDAAFRRDRAGGGALLDKGVHTLDQLSWLFGPPKVTRCRDDSLRGGVETNSVLDLEFQHARGVMQVSWEFPLQSGVSIRGSAGELWLDGGDIRSYRRRNPGGGWQRIPARKTWPGDTLEQTPAQRQPGNYHACFELQLIALVRAVLHGEPLAVDGAQAALVQATIDRAYELAEPLEFGWLPASERVAMNAKHWRQAA